MPRHPHRVLIALLMFASCLATRGVAEDSAADEKDAKPTAASVAPTTESANDRIEAALASPIKFSFDNATIEDVVLMIRRNYDIPVYLDQKSLEEAAIAISTEVKPDFNYDDLSLSDVLSLAFRPIDLTYMPWKGVLYITTKTTADTTLDTHIYDVSELMGDLDVDSLIELLTSILAPTTWSDVGGAGAIKRCVVGDSTLLVVSQTYLVHREVDSLIAELRKYSDGATGKRRTPRPKHLSDEPRAAFHLSQTFVDAHQRFACDLLQAQSERKGNVLLGPWNIMATVIPLGAGARGATQDELANVLHLAPGFSGVATDFAEARSYLKALHDSEACILRSSSGLWLRSEVTPKPDFLQALDGYGAEIKSLPADGEIARDMINRWVEDRTEGTIKKLIAEPLDENSPLVLASALHFNGAWQHKFPKDRTRAGEFHLGSKTKSVMMMSMADVVGYANVDKVKILDKPFAGGELSMTILLPSENDSALEELEKTLTPAKLKEWLEACSQRLVDITLPKFKLSTRTDLVRTFETLGAPLPFNPRDADFRDILEDEPLFISQFTHEVSFEVDELGAVASSATMAVGTFGGPAPPPRPSFVADHPFLFLIRSTKTGLILFVGRIVDPPPSLGVGRGTTGGGIF